MPLSPLLSAYDQVILDLDGTVWVGGAPTPDAAGAITALRSAGKRVAFLTNDGTRTPEESVRKLWSIGCTAAPEEIVSVGSAVQYLLAAREPGLAVYVIGAPAMARHVELAGHRVVNHTAAAESADVVVVSTHRQFDYAELMTGIRALEQGAELISCGRDRTFPSTGGLEPGTGALTAALEYATGVGALSVGKPEPVIFEVALDRLGSGRTIVIGDHLDSDLGGAAAAGLDAALVLSGVTTAEAAAAASDPAPVAVAANLAALVLSS